MSRRRWVWAVGLLKLARVLGASTGSADSILIGDVGSARRRWSGGASVREPGVGDADSEDAELGGEDAEGKRVKRVKGRDA
jgi:hypothetical protein